MKLPESLSRYVERVDAMTLRERLLIFFAVLVLLVFLVNSVFFDPLLARQFSIATQLEQQQSQVSDLQTRLAGLARARSSAGSTQAAKSAQLAELKATLDSLNANIQGQEAELVQPERMNALVADLVRRNRGVQLVSLKSLPTEQLNQGGSTLYRHGVEVTVSGTFSDLVAYLADFESMPLKVSWGRLDLDAKAYPVISLDIVLSTLSTGKPWLQI